MLLSILLILLGIACGWLLFYGLRFLLPLKQGESLDIPSISVIIPARNEAHNLPGLLQSLSLQTITPDEIICVDDASTDGTFLCAQAYGAKVLRIENKPEGWMGKSYACHLGAQQAKGSLFLFLDADVRLDENVLERLLHTWSIHGPVVSVQPWHACVRLYEQCCLFFNVIAAAALAVPPLFGRATAGLFGPVILMPAELYQKCGGHEAIKGSVLDDVSLGQSLHTLGVKAYCCQGGLDLRYRMYPKGTASMVEGWTKNFASGAGASRLNLWVLIVLWMSALIGVPLQFLEFLSQTPTAGILLFYVLAYFVICFQLLEIGRKIGRFSPFLMLFYPLPLLVFLLIFFRSIMKKLFRRPVFWKGRDVSAGN